MKLPLTLVLIVIINAIKTNEAQNNNLSESKIALSDGSNKTKTFTEQHSIESIFSKHKKFLLTRKPAININRTKQRRIKKKPLTTKVQNKRTIYAHNTNPTQLYRKLHKFRKPRLANKKYSDKAKINQHMKNLFQKTINNTDNSDEETREKTAIVCTGPEIKNILLHPNRIAIKEIWFLSNYKLKDMLKVRKCFLKFKRLENFLLSNKIKDKQIKLNTTVQRTLNTSESNVVDSTINVDLIENKFNLNKMNLINELKHKTNASLVNDEKVTTENIIHNSRSKRSINIIEEEGVATTSSGFKYVGRDLALYSEFFYRNIHN